MELFLKGKFDNGEVVVLNKDSLRPLLTNYNGQMCEITIRPLKKMMSAAQMRWYRGVAINTIIQGLKEADGRIWSHDDIHAYNIAKIMKPKITTKEILGETIVETKKFSMASMTKAEFEWFKTELQAFWAERGIDIPDPNEENFLNGENKTGINSISGFTKKNT